jgi:hypothetical protein
MDLIYIQVRPLAPLVASGKTEGSRRYRQGRRQGHRQAGRQAHNNFIVRISYLNWVQNIIFIMITNGSGITIPNGTRWGS